MSQSLVASGKQQSLKTSQKLLKGGYDTNGLGLSTKKAASSVLRKSTGNLSAHLSSTRSKSYNTTKSSADLERIEAEYIKNLQQQVYFLELETNYLREQARKTAELQPQMSVEAKRMLDKLRELQAELDATKLEMKHKESGVEVIQMEKERVMGKLKAAEDSFKKEKRLLLDEIVQLKKEKELLDRTLVNKDAQLVDVQQHLEMTESSCRSTENKQRLIESQLSQKEDQLKLLQKTLDDKRAELLKAEEKLRRTEEQYYSSAALVNDRVKDDLRVEIQLLKQKMKEIETYASQDRLLRSKMTDDSAQVARENATLSQRILELKSRLDRERSVQNDSLDSHRGQTIGGELIRSKDHQSHYHLELDQAKEQLRLEQLRIKQITDQLTANEQRIKSQQLSETALQNRVAETAARNDTLQVENYRLRCDKDALIDRVAQLQKQLEENELVTRDLEEQIQTLEGRLRALEQLQSLQSSIHSQKWEEFSRLAESMKTLSHTMIQTTTNQKPWIKSADLDDYS